MSLQKLKQELCLLWSAPTINGEHAFKLFRYFPGHPLFGFFTLCELINTAGAVAIKGIAILMLSATIFTINIHSYMLRISIPMSTGIRDPI